MFCDICRNFMDITNNVSMSDKNQLGGSNDDINLVINDNEESELESSDYDINNSDSMLSESNLNDILKGADVEFDFKNFNQDELNKNTTFNKLSNNQKTLVINRILEKMPKTKVTKIAENIASKDSYYYCKSCGYNLKIPDKEFIFSRGDEKKDDPNNFKFINYKYDNTCPNTKKYTCINDECITHAEPIKKNAKFWRNKSSYNTKYMCTLCDHHWSTFNEK